MAENLKPQSIQIAKKLMQLGALPFIALTLARYFNITFVPNTKFAIQELYTSYAFFIIIFTTGTYWGIGLMAARHRFLFIMSNIISVIVWLAHFAIFDLQILYSIFIASFITLLAIDWRLYDDKVTSLSYWRTRFFITLIVLSTLGFQIWQLNINV
jgi:hypothetical protein